MFFQRSDKVYEEATRNPERFEWLCNHYRRVRTWTFYSFVAATAALLIFAAWFGVETFRFLETLGGHAGLPPSTWFEHVLRDKGSVERIALTAFCWSVSSLVMALAADSKVKNLILFRALRDGVASKPPE